MYYVLFKRYLGAPHIQCQPQVLLPTATQCP